MTDKVKFVYEDVKELVRTAHWDDLPDILKTMSDDDKYDFDYSATPEMIAACCEATAHALSDKYGITGFQASWVGLRFLWRFNGYGSKCGFKILDYDNMLYPQSAYRFDKVIGRSVMEDLETEARKLIESKNKEKIHPDVWKHWESLADGNPPFGFRLIDD